MLPDYILTVKALRAFLNNLPEGIDEDMPVCVPIDQEGNERHCLLADEGTPEYSIDSYGFPISRQDREIKFIGLTLWFCGQYLVEYDEEEDEEDEED